MKEESLATMRPDLAKEWHPTKNGALTPKDVTISSNRKVWWLLPYDDPKTGKHFDFEWCASIANRKERGCPYLVGKAVCVGYNDLATNNPKLAKEWHPTKNGTLTPKDVTASSNRKVWWLLPYDDPRTGKHFDFEWTASISNRIKTGCPYLTGKAVWPGYNDLQTVCPDIAKEWHLTRNGELTPKDISFGSEKKVWWTKKYIDSDSGEIFSFEWEAAINHRVNGVGNPYESGKAVMKGYNDLQSKYPELAKEWHATKNEGLLPDQVTAGSGRKVWWQIHYCDPQTGKSYDFEWQDSIYHRVAGRGCPVFSGKSVVAGFNDLASISPELASQWNIDKNNGLQATEVAAHSNKKYWWIYQYDDPKSGKHFDFEWQASPAVRLRSSGCPYISNQILYKGFNDLASKRPDLALQWNYKKNGSMQPSDFFPNSKKYVWWIYPYDDPVTGKHFDFEWQETIGNRNQDSGCPFLNNQRIQPGFNDFESSFPEIAAEWDDEKNGALKPNMVACTSDKKVWWVCPKCGKSWRCSVKHRTNGQSCSCCK